MVSNLWTRSKCRKKNEDKYWTFLVWIIQKKAIYHSGTMKIYPLLNWLWLFFLEIIHSISFTLSNWTLLDFLKQSFVTFQCPWPKEKDKIIFILLIWKTAHCANLVIRFQEQMCFFKSKSTKKVLFSLKRSGISFNANTVYQTC